MADVITCPSGLTGRVRGMKVREERVLADRKLAKSGGQIDELLAACWEETLDAGPYSLGEGGKLDLGKVLQGDRFFALLMVRALTWQLDPSALGALVFSNCSPHRSKQPDSIRAFGRMGKHYAEQRRRVADAGDCGATGGTRLRVLLDQGPGDGGRRRVRTHALGRR